MSDANCATVVASPEASLPRSVDDGTTPGLPTGTAADGRARLASRAFVPPWNATRGPRLHLLDQPARTTRERRNPRCAPLVERVGVNYTGRMCRRVHARVPVT
jgi:hypothetical protein